MASDGHWTVFPGPSFGPSSFFEGAEIVGLFSFCTSLSVVEATQALGAITFPLPLPFQLLVWAFPSFLLA